jgi:hypothetical protein
MVTNLVEIEDFIGFAESKAGEQFLFAADVPISCAAEALPSHRECMTRDSRSETPASCLRHRSR